MEEKRTYTGVVTELDYAHQTGVGYESAICLECENGESVPLAISGYGSIFEGMIGAEINITIDVLND